MSHLNQKLKFATTATLVAIALSGCSGGGTETLNTSVVAQESTDVQALNAAPDDASSGANSAMNADYKDESIDLSPITYTKSVLPNDYAVVNYTLANGNWRPNISLPPDANNGARINISNEANYAVRVTLTNFQYALDAITLQKGKALSLRFDAASGRWQTNAVAFTPRTLSSDTLPESDEFITTFKVANGNWQKRIKLPQSSSNSRLISIERRSTWGLAIDGANIINHADINTVRNGDYVFIYHRGLAGWSLIDAPNNTLLAHELKSEQIPDSKYAERTLYASNAGDLRRIVLPVHAVDGDRFHVISDADYELQIDPANIEANSGTLIATAGQEYHFRFDAEVHKWRLHKSPEITLLAKHASATLPAMRAPTLNIRSADANWKPDFTLPSTATPGDRVVFVVNSTYPVTVHSAQGNMPSEYLQNGEEVVFTRSAQNTWARETHTMDLLLVHDKKSVDKIGLNAERARLFAGLDLTNEALRNSGAHARFRRVGIMQHDFDAFYKSLNNVLSRASTVLEIDAARTRLKADAVYVEGVFEGCGLAWVNYRAQQGLHTMLGAGSLNCGTTVMRHELGHNLGLAHGLDAVGQTTPRDNTAHGYIGAGTVMGGNRLPYYSTPLRFDDTGLKLGRSGVVDATRIINRNAPFIANFR